MNKKTICTLAVVAALLTGCARTAPIHNVNQTLTQRYSDNQMKLAIIEAGIGRKWVMTPRFAWRDQWSSGPA
ncbi:outer membrane biogenesis lipoprotein LolB [Pantoea agglomerans]